MKTIIIAMMLTSLTVAAGILNKTPSKEFLSKKIGIWVPSLAEPEARNYTLEEFVDGAFRNVNSKDWEETDDSWILIIKIKDPMTKKKSTAKMQFLKSDKVAGPRRITMDGEDLPMQNASPIMHTFLANVAEKVGSRAEPVIEKKSSGSSMDRFIGKYCKDAKLEIKSISGENATISGSSKDVTSCNFKDKVFKVTDPGNNEAISIKINSNCSLYVEPRGRNGKHLVSVYLSTSCSTSTVTELNDCTVNVFDGMFGSCGK